MVDISDLVGLPYKMHGRNGEGLDCFGLIRVISLRNGTPIKDPVYKGFDPALSKLAGYIGFVKIDKFETGCILEIEKEERLHLGYAIDEENMIHSTIGEGVIVENISKYDVKGFYTWAQ
jgi:hypothetical protein